MERLEAILESQSARLDGHERALWRLVAVLLVGDVGLTAWGRSLGLVELNPVGVALLTRFGTLGLLVAKLLVALPALVWWVGLPDPYARVVPLLLAVPWAVACTVNLTLVAVVLL